MEIKINLSEKFLKLAATTLQLAAADDEDYEKMINEVVSECKDMVLTLDPSDFGNVDGKRFCVALGVYAIAKVLKDKRAKEEKDFMEMLKNGLNRF